PVARAPSAGAPVTGSTLAGATATGGTGPLSAYATAGAAASAVAVASTTSMGLLCRWFKTINLIGTSDEEEKRGNTPAAPISIMSAYPITEINRYARMTPSRALDERLL
ncbi:hypothetical protein ABT317_06475, partial [Streptomyces carpinensis]